MLLNRISLRVATAVGSAAMVAGATFAVSAFADSGAEPDDAVSSAVVPPQADAGADFFADAPQLSEDELAEQRASIQNRIEEAGGSVSGSATAAEEQEEEEEEESGDDSGSTPVPSGDPKGIAQAMLGDYGWGDDEFSCLEPLWEKESNWNPSAENPSSGAYGIPQALPGSKMESAGSDWQTNPATQISWGLGYIEDRYGSPCGAWEHSEANGWY